MRKVAVILAAMILAGCSSIQADIKPIATKIEADIGVAKQDASTVVSRIKGDVGQIQQFTLADIQAALDDAIAHQDGTGIACWAAAKEAVGGPLPVGVASTIQKGRDVMAVNLPFKCQNIIPGLSMPALPPGIIPAIP